MNRRALLKSLPAALVVGAVPAVAVASEESPIAAMHREIICLRDALDNGKVFGEEADAAAARLEKLANLIVDLPARNLGEMMLKFMGHTIHGDHETGDCPRSEALWAEARALVA